MFYLQTAYVWRVHSRDDVTFIENKFKFCFLEHFYYLNTSTLFFSLASSVHAFDSICNISSFFKTPTRAAYKYCISHNADTSSQLRIQHNFIDRCQNDTTRWQYRIHLLKSKCLPCCGCQSIPMGLCTFAVLLKLSWYPLHLIIIIIIFVYNAHCAGDVSLCYQTLVCLLVSPVVIVIFKHEPVDLNWL